MSYSSQLIIQEVTAPKGGSQGRAVTLLGAGLPLMGTEWGGENQVVTTWYAGNGDEATQQILGPREMPSSWRGEWNLTMLVNSPCIYVDENGATSELVNPTDLMDVLETIFRQGLVLQVTWAVQSSTDDPSATGKIVRVGAARSWKWTFDRWQDCKWSMDFDWKGRGLQVAKVASTRDNTVNSNGAAFQNAMNALIDAANAAQLADQAPTHLTLGQLEAVANYPNAVANSLSRSVQSIESQVGQVVQIAATLASQPVQVVNRALDLAQDTVANVNNFYDTLSQVPLETQVTKQDVASILFAAKRFGAVSDDALAVADAGRTFTLQLRAAAQATALTGEITPTRVSDPSSVEQIHICRQGETPETISIIYFQTPDHAVDILRANRLSWHTSSFPQGKILVIPALTGNPGYIGA